MYLIRNIKMQYYRYHFNSFHKYNEIEILYLAKNVIIIKPWIPNIKKKLFYSNVIKQKRLK